MMAVTMLDNGLSPRMRGNLPITNRGIVRLGSIPAYAGEPRLSAVTQYVRRVYPRVCGGTAAVLLPSPGSGGLSPRMRGNPMAAGAGGARGSIPAYAGEPRTGVV